MWMDSIIFIILILVVPFVYCVGGAAYLYKKEEKRGRELIPHREFWGSIPGYTKDGCGISYRATKSCIGTLILFKFYPKHSNLTLSSNRRK